MRRVRIIAKLLFILFLINIAFAGIPYYTYIYNERRRPVPSLPGFEPELIISGETINPNLSFSAPEDLFIDKSNGDIYVADTGNNRIVVIGKDYKLKEIIDGFINNGKKDLFKAPTGLFITRDGRLYIADSKNSRIVVLNKDRSLYMIIGKPVGDVIKVNFDIFQRRLR